MYIIDFRVIFAVPSSFLHTVSIYYHMLFSELLSKRRYEEIEKDLKAVDTAFDKWKSCVIELETFCGSDVIELEQTRLNVNIASIVGSSAGLVSTLALAGFMVAPFTGGISVFLALLGGLVSTGSKLTETSMNTKSIKQFKSLQLELEERSMELKSALYQLLGERGEFFLTKIVTPTIGGTDVDLTATKATGDSGTSPHN